MKGLIIINTGDGKGKTTAALGLLMRAAGHDKKCAVVQFIKSGSAHYGEIVTLDRLGIENYTIGAGFTWEADIHSSLNAIQEAWNKAKQLIESGAYAMIVLDEINIALWFCSNNPGSFNFLKEVKTTLENKPGELHLVLTGRYALPEIVALADTVIEMQTVKHHYNAGVEAMKCIEF